MTERKTLILDTIIREHISTGQPVGSSVIVKKYNLDISSATVRSTMAELEDEGYIIQPHTSAGRIPTEIAYRYHIGKIDFLKKPFGQKVELIDEIFATKNPDFRKVAKLLSEFSGNAVFWAMHKNNLYYTGITNLFQQPEFAQIDTIYSISSVVDRFDEIIDDIFERLDYGQNILLGSENPFGAFCGTVVSKYKNNDKTGLFGVLGPIRMNYSNNLFLIKYINEKINNL